MRFSAYLIALSPLFHPFVNETFSASIKFCFKAAQGRFAGKGEVRCSDLLFVQIKGNWSSLGEFYSKISRKTCLLWVAVLRNDFLSKVKGQILDDHTENHKRKREKECNGHRRPGRCFTKNRKSWRSCRSRCIFVSKLQIQALKKLSNVILVNTCKTWHVKQLSCSNFHIWSKFSRFKHESRYQEKTHCSVTSCNKEVLYKSTSTSTLHIALHVRTTSEILITMGKICISQLSSVLFIMWLLNTYVKCRWKAPVECWVGCGGTSKIVDNNMNTGAQKAIA